jgi:hypothetical protein
VDQDAATKNYVDQIVTGTASLPLSVANGGTGGTSGGGGWAVVTAATALPASNSLEVDMDLGFDYRIEWFGMNIDEKGYMRGQVYEAGAWQDLAGNYYNTYTNISEEAAAIQSAREIVDAKVANEGVFRTAVTDGNAADVTDTGRGSLTLIQPDNANVRTFFLGERHRLEGNAPHGTYSTGVLAHEWERVSAERTDPARATKFRLIHDLYSPNPAPVFTAGYYVVWKCANGNSTS